MKKTFLALIIPALSWGQEVVELEEVKVLGETSPFAALTNDKVAGKADLKVWGEQDTFSAPISVVSYSEKIIEDQAPRTITDMLGKNDASVMGVGGEAFTLDGVAIRGFRVDSREFSLNGLPGLLGYQSSTAYVGGVDVIKGANMALGSSSTENAVGGAVNVKSKVASNEDLNRVSLGWFENNRLQESLDVSRRFGDNKEWGIRFNAQYRNGDTPRKSQDEEHSTIALNTDYQGERVRGQFDFIHNNRHQSAQRGRFDTVNNYKFQLPSAPNGKTNLAQPWSFQDSDESIVMAKGEFDINPNLTVYGGIGHSEVNMQQLFAQEQMTKANGDFRDQSGGYYDFNMRTTSGNLGLRGKGQTGSISHNYGISYEISSRQRDHASNAMSAKNTPSYRKANNIYNFQYYPAPTISDKDFATHTDSQYWLSSLGISDTLGFAEDKVKLTLGGRLQDIHARTLNPNTNKETASYAEKKFNPFITLAYQPSPDLMAYANYMQDFQEGDTVIEENGEIKSLSPYETKQYEVGLRKDFGNLAATAAIYQIETPTLAYENYNSYAPPHGKAKFRGLEVNTYSKLLDDKLRIGLGASLQKGEYENQENARENGKETVATPKIIAKAGVEYDLLENLTLKAGAQHYGSVYQDKENLYKISSYTLFDAGLRYDAKIAGKDMRINLGVDNLFNKNYWATHNSRQSTRSFAVVGMPRTIWLTGRLDL